MDNLYILTKQEFTSLYRFGKLPLNPARILKMEKDIESKVYEEFLSLPYFVGDEEYLIISFENSVDNDMWVEINLVSEIIPLTRAAKRSYEMKFDARLNFGEPRFESVFHRVEEYIDIQERFMGAKAFWKLCRIQEAYKPMLKEELVLSAYNKRINGIRSSDFSEDFFVHLFAYDRYEFFPNSDLGFFYDIGEIFAHSKGKPSFNGSKFHSFLESNKNRFLSKSFMELAALISESNEITNFTAQLTSDDLRLYMAAAIFLKFKSDLDQRDTIKGSDTGRLVSSISKDKNFIRELHLAIHLTGAFFGYKKFYDDLYELTNLKIFKHREAKHKELNQADKKQDEIYNENMPFVIGVSNVVSTEEEKVTKEQDGKPEKMTKSENRIFEKDLAEVKDLEDSFIPKDSALDGAVNASKVISTEEEKVAKRPNQKSEKIEKSGKVINKKDLLENKDLDDSIEPENSGLDGGFSEIEESIYTAIEKMVAEDKGSVEIKTDRLKQLIKLVSPLQPEKTVSKKDDVIQILREKYEEKLSINVIGKKYILSIGTGKELFISP